jgi:hypothetical protein
MAVAPHPMYAGHEGNVVQIAPVVILIVIAIKFLIGSGIGLVVAALIYRSRFGGWLAFRAAIFAGMGYLIATLIAGGAGLHAAFQNGQRVDVAPWGEDLWLRNRIVENETVLCIASSAIASLLAGVRFGRSRRTRGIH